MVLFHRRAGSKPSRPRRQPEAAFTARFEDHASATEDRRRTGYSRSLDPGFQTRLASQAPSSGTLTPFFATCRKAAPGVHTRRSSCDGPRWLDATKRGSPRAFGRLSKTPWVSLFEWVRAETKPLRPVWLTDSRGEGTTHHARIPRKNKGAERHGCVGTPGLHRGLKITHTRISHNNRELADVAKERKEAPAPETFGTDPADLSRIAFAQRSDACLCRS